MRDGMWKIHQKVLNEKSGNYSPQMISGAPKSFREDIEYLRQVSVPEICLHRKDSIQRDSGFEVYACRMRFALFSRHATKDKAPEDRRSVKVRRLRQTERNAQKQEAFVARRLKNNYFAKMKAGSSPEIERKTW